MLQILKDCTWCKMDEWCHGWVFIVLYFQSYVIKFQKSISLISSNIYYIYIHTYTLKLHETLDILLDIKKLNCGRQMKANISGWYSPSSCLFAESTCFWDSIWFLHIIQANQKKGSLSQTTLLIFLWDRFDSSLVYNDLNDTLFLSFTLIFTTPYGTDHVGTL